jgi:hypothetical protein
MAPTADPYIIIEVINRGWADEEAGLRAEVFHDSRGIEAAQQPVIKGN